MLEFVLPVSRGDLLTATTTSYAVNETCSVRGLLSKVQDCQRRLVREGLLGVLQYFDVLYSVLHEWKSTDVNVKEDAWNIVLKGCETTVRELVSVINRLSNSDSTLNRSLVSEYRNSTKMHTYLLCQLVEMIENDLTAESNVAAATKVGRGRGKPSTARNRAADATFSFDWPAECTNAVTTLDQLCKLEIKNLWDPPVVEEDFVNLLANCCYKLLENKSLAANVSVRTAITNLLTTLIHRYKHGIACCVKLAQLLQCFAHMANCLSLIVNCLMEEESMVPFVKELLNEICSYNSEDLERDSSATHNFCLFLETVSSTHPVLAVSVLPLIRSRLNEDPYQMRNCALSVIGEVLRNLCSRPQLEVKDKIQRDRLMDVLQEHIHDVNGFVRARALQIWYNLASAKGLPVKRQVQLARLLVGPEGAINDISSFARKYALRLLTAMLVQSPAAKLSASDLVNVLTKEEERLKLLEDNFATIYNAEVQAALPGANPDEGMETDGNVEQRADANANRKKTKNGKKKLNFSSSEEESEDLTEEEDSKEGSLKSGKRTEAGETRGRRKRRQVHDGTQYVNRSSSEDTLVGVDVQDQTDSRNSKAATEQGFSEAAAALEAVIHSAALVAQHDADSVGASDRVSTSSQGRNVSQVPANGDAPPVSMEVALEACKSDLVRQRACVAYLREIDRFAKYMATAIEDVRNMLHAKTASDVLEAIEFFLTAKQAGVKNLDESLRHMLTMIWSQEESIRKAVLDACRRLYFQPDLVNESFTADGRLSPAALAVVISTLVHLVCQSSLGDLVSLERILNELLRLGHVDEDLKSELWTRFIDLAASRTQPSGSFDRDRELKALLILLQMTAESGRTALMRHLDDLVNYGLGNLSGFNHVDLDCAMHACIVIQKLAPSEKPPKYSKEASTKTPSTNPSCEPFRLPPSHQLCVCLRKLLISTFSSPSRIDWIPLMEQAVATIFLLIDTPTRAIAEIIRESGEYLLKYEKSEEPPPATKVEECNGVPDEAAELSSSQLPRPPSSAGSHGKSLVVPSFLLTRFIALIGHVAMKMLVYLEFSVLNELKRREVAQEEKSTFRTKHKAPRSARRSKLTADTSAGTSSDLSGSQNNSAMEEEAGLVGAVADDAEADYIRRVLDNEVLLQPDHMLARLLPLVVYVCTHQSKFSDPDLQAAASLALVKFMLVSAVVCERHLQLLFTLAERSPSEVVRANLVVGLGDLARRFPNLIEPWTPNLYARLRDSSSKVRINALNTLSHLILNDMVKVKGQISEMTVCLIDGTERLKQLSRLFFRELSQKGNALYNVMPDIISRLSDPEVGVEECKFRQIVDFLFPLIEKERLCETLVEKICARFRVTQTERQWRDLAYCLSVMSYNERMVRTLQENLPIFAQQLSIVDVYSAFKEILSSARKSAKPDFLPQLDEFEAKVNEFHQKGVADEEAVRRAEIMAKQAAKQGRRKTTIATDGLKSSRRRHHHRSSPNKRRTSEEQEETSSSKRLSCEEDDAEERPVLRSTRARTRERVTREVFSSDED
uniref:Condensin complex subunit 1 n=1 Tax=Schistocephalus solidus TaxID=70667 RepID=A0A0X3NLV6_SCHSO